MIKRPLLAARLEIEKLMFPVMASPKIDGIRCLLHEGVAYSRKLKPIPNRFVQEWARRHRRLSGLDGELMVGSPTAADAFRVTTSGVMSEDGEPDFTFLAFDLWDEPTTPFSERLDQVKRLVEGAHHAQVVNHEWLRAEWGGPDEVFNYLANREAEGYEGAMLRNPNGLYKQGRATMTPTPLGQELVKVKSFVDGEATIIAVHELMRNHNEQERDARGLAKRSNKKEGMVAAGTLGAIECELNGVTFKVGSGYDQDLRDKLWSKRRELIGRQLKYKYFEGGSKDRPRFPVFVGLRDERD